MDLFRPTVFCFSAKVAIIKTKSASIAFFSSPSFFLPSLPFSPFLFHRYCDFGAYRAQKTPRLLRPFQANDCKVR